MPKPILLLAAATAIGAASVAVPGLDLRLGSDPPSNLVLTGACDASGGLLPDGRYLIVADDEDARATILRVYDVTTGQPIGNGITATDAVKAEPATEEVDLEGLSRFGASSFVAIASHSLTKKAKPAPSRRRIVSFTLAGMPPNQTIATSHRYANLVADATKALGSLPASHPLKGFAFDNGKAPNDGGLSIEAIADTAAAGELLIGLRGPLGPGKKAIVLHLTNAGDALAGTAPGSFATPIMLDLGGKGLRDLVRVGPGRYLLIAGDPGDGGTFELWQWSGPGALTTLTRMGPIATPAAGTSAEALVLTPDRTAAWVLFDEGQRMTAGGTACKDLQNAADKSFHARRVALSGF